MRNQLKKVSENGSTQDQNVALTVVHVPSSLDSGPNVAICPHTAGWWSMTHRCRANMAHTRQSRLESGLGFQVKVLETFKVSPLRSNADVKTSTYKILAGSLRSLWERYHESSRCSRDTYPDEMVPQVEGEWLVTQESFLSDFDTSLDASGMETRALKVRKTARIKVCPFSDLPCLFSDLPGLRAWGLGSVLSQTCLHFS